MSTPQNTRLTPELRQQIQETLNCRRDFVYFVDTYCQLLAVKEDGSGAGEWQRFRLWPAQRETAQLLVSAKQVVILKARQLGFTWLTLAFALWQMLFKPIATVLLFSKRDDEASEMLSMRLRGMYDHLPEFLQVRSFATDGLHEWELSNGSRAMAFPTTGGRSYTATLALVDEADYVPDLQALLNAVKPTIDAGGRLVLLSSSDKGQEESLFKRIYRAARSGADHTFRHVFYPWQAAPWRTQQWYEQEKRRTLAQTGALDSLHQEYPATDTEALAPNSLDKRIPSPWLEQCFVEQAPLEVKDAPAIPGLMIFVAPQPGRRYVIGMDSAEENPTSDDSALTVLDLVTGEEVAALAARLEPSVFASYGYQIACYYHKASLMVERNNHGHAVLLWLHDHARELIRLSGHDGKTGWMSSTLGKSLLFDQCAAAFKNQEVLLHSFSTFTQLASIEGATLKAPEGRHDDRAVGFALAVCARKPLARSLFSEADRAASISSKIPVFVLQTGGIAVSPRGLGG